MKTCVFIIGTNGSGKTTLAKALIARCGGIASATKRLTELKDARFCLAGKYSDASSYGGVDGFGTGQLEGVVREALATHETIFCEGSYLDTFGLNLLRAIFVADRQLVVCLRADAPVLAARIAARSGNRLTQSTLAKQDRRLRCVGKWRSVGVKTIVADTGRLSEGDIVGKVFEIVGGSYA